jgi:hypothetical protein
MYWNQEQNRERRRDHAAHHHTGQRLLRLHPDATPLIGPGNSRTSSAPK